MHVSVQTMNRTSYPFSFSLLLPSLELSDIPVVYQSMRLKYEPSSQQDYAGDTPMHVSVRNLRLHTSSRLVELGADVRVRNDAGESVKVGSRKQPWTRPTVD